MTPEQKTKIVDILHSVKWNNDLITNWLYVNHPEIYEKFNMTLQERLEMFAKENKAICDRRAEIDELIEAVKNS